MKNYSGLTSVCRNCGQPVKYGRLPPFPEDDPRSSSGNAKYRGWREVWYHHRAELGEEIVCETLEPGRKYASPKDYCHESTKDGYSGICNRAIKDKDLLMCGIHATRLRKLKERDEKEKQDREVRGYVMAETTALQQTLKDRFGLDTKLDFSWATREYTGMIIVNPRELLSFLEEIFDA